ncbi:MAG: DUF6443 domain-containing protein, partial [Flavobacteriales bacterium]|nr:DUF6443 domain-containing protein [Flavobacteriales bacterium]
NGATTNSTLLPDRPTKYIPADTLSYLPAPSIEFLKEAETCSGNYPGSGCQCEDPQFISCEIDNVIITDNWNDHLLLTLNLTKFDPCNGIPVSGTYSARIKFYKKNGDGSETLVSNKIYGFDNANQDSKQLDFEIPIHENYTWIERGAVYRIVAEKNGDFNRPFKVHISVSEIKSGLGKYDKYPQWNDKIHKYYDSEYNLYINPWLADRLPNSDEMQNGLLNKIIYPTGGSTEFQFEPHDYKNTYALDVRNDEDGGSSCNPGNGCADCLNGISAEVNDFQFSFPDDETYYEITATAWRPDAAGAVNTCDPNWNALDGSLYIIDENSGEKRTLAILLGADEGSRSFTWSFPHDFPVDPNTTYTIGVSKNNPNYILKLDFTIWRIGPETFTENVMVGGVRVKSIIKDPVTSKGSVQRFSYLNEKSGAWSSGKLIGIPAFLQKAPHWDPNKFRAQAAICTGTAYQSALPTPVQFYFTSNSAASMGSTEGMHIGYEKVQVDYENVNQGYTEYEYHILKNPGISFARHEFPVSPNWYQDLDTSYYLNGKIRKVSYFKESGVKVSTKEHRYEILEVNQSLQRQVSFYTACQNPVVITMWSLTLGLDVTSAGSGYTTLSRNFQGLAANYYQQRSAIVREISTIDTLDNVAKLTTVSYDPQLRHLNPISRSFVNSDGRTHQTNFRYAHETGNQALIAKNMTQIPLEVTNEIDGSITSGMRTQFGTINGQLVPTDFDELGLSGVSRRVMVVDEVDAKGNVLSYHQPEDISISSLTGYNNQVTIAKCINAGVDEFAFASFEEGANTGGWTFQNTIPGSSLAVVGAAGYQLTSFTPISKSNIPQNLYIVSFWLRSGSVDVEANGIVMKSFTNATGVPKYQTLTVDFSNANPNNTIEITGQAQIDELRLHPKGSFMTTYNYNSNDLKLVAVSDYNGIPMFYEYDDFNRLVHKKDHQGNIVEAYDYQYNINVGLNQTSRIEIKESGIQDANDLANMVMSDYTETKSFVDGLGRPIQNSIVNGLAQNDLINIFTYDSSGSGNKTFLPFSGNYAGNFIQDREMIQGLKYGSLPTNNKFPYAEVEYHDNPLARIKAESVP